MPRKRARYFQKAGVARRIDVRVGDALEILSEEKPASLDIIFNDVDKEDYPRVFKLAVPRLKPGGLFITDNVLWSGRVADPKNSEPTTQAIREFNRSALWLEGSVCQRHPAAGWSSGGAEALIQVAIALRA